MANTYLTRTPSSAGSTTKATLSAWVKKADITTTQDIYSLRLNNDNQLRLRLRDNGAITIYISVSNSTVVEKRSTRLLRDTSGWYHVVLVTDLTESSAEDKYKIYINNERITSWSVNTNTSATSYNYIVAGGGSYVMNIGCNGGQNGEFFSGSMSHFHFIDGTAYDATAFGETDSTTGEWKINTSPSVTYGTNGFFILKDGNSVTDQSGNSNNFTVGGGTLTKTEDSPSNVFPTFGNGNIIPNNSTNSFSQGSLTLTNSSAIWQSEILPFAFSSGKYYWEVKLNHNGSDPRIGLGTMNESNFNINTSGNNSFFRNQTGGYGFHSGGSGGDYVYANGSSIGGTQTSNFDAINGTICGIAVDCDNKRMYLSVNGTWENSANPSNGTNPYDVSSGWTTGDLMFPFITTHNSNVNFNFGNGYFGTTAVSSAGTNASGIGIFEHDVPENFTALSTKGLNL